MIKISIIIFVLAACVDLHSQLLPLDVNAKPTIKFEQFGSGIIYNFEDNNNEISNSYAYELWLTGEIEYKTGNYNDAKKFLIEYVESEIVGEPPYLYQKYWGSKHHACNMLKNIFYSEKEYKRSYYYYLKARDYPYGLRCGYFDKNFTEEDIYLFDCYQAIGRDDLAAYQFMLKIFSSKPADTAICIKLYSLLLKSNDKDYLKSEMKKILNKVELIFDGVYFLGKMIYVYVDYADFRKKYSDEEKIIAIKNEVINNPFYKLIMEN